MSGDPAAAVEVKSVVVGDGVGSQIPAIRLQLGNETLTTRQLIGRAVEQQVDEIVRHRRLTSRAAREALDRQYLTRREIRQQASQGEVRMPAAPETAAIDLPVEIERACRGFEEGAFKVLVDGHPVAGLDEPLRLRPSTRVTFLRLIPMAGG